MVALFHNRPAPEDFNGDHASDVVLQDPTGTIHFLYGSTTGAFSVGPALNWAPGATIVGLGDFNGDGRQDFLEFGGYSNEFGTLLISALQTNNSGFQSDWEAATMVPAGWSIAGTGDFNGDGKTDVLLRNTDGTVTDWLVGPPNATIVDVPDAPFVKNANLNVNPGSNWHVAGIGDFNGDGRADILWRAEDGTVREWLGQADGTFVGNFANVNVNPGTNWYVAATGDFNGDGRDDVVWRNDDGTVREWLGQSNGSFSGNFANVNVNPGTNWHIVAAGDYNGDGYSDLLWRDDQGTMREWLGSSSGAFSGNFANVNFNPGSDWQVQPNATGAGAWDY